MAKPSKKGKQKADTPTASQPAAAPVSIQPDVSQPIVAPPPSPPNQPAEVPPNQHVLLPSTGYLATVEEVEDDAFGDLDVGGLDNEGGDDWAEVAKDEAWPAQGYNGAPVDDDGWTMDQQMHEQVPQPWPPPQAPPPPPVKQSRLQPPQQHQAPQHAWVPPPPSVAASHGTGKRAKHAKQHVTIAAPPAKGEWANWGREGANSAGDWDATHTAYPPSQGGGEWGNYGGGQETVRGWDQPESEWEEEYHTASPQISTHKQGGWMDWGHEGKRLPKSQTYQAALAGAAAALPHSGSLQTPESWQSWPQQSAQQQHQYQHQQHLPQYHETPSIQLQQPQAGKKGKKNKQAQQEQNQKQNQPSKKQKRQQQHQLEQQQYEDAQWGDWGNGWDDQAEDQWYGGEEEEAWDRRVHFSPQHQHQQAPDTKSAPRTPATVVENFTVNAFPPNQLGLSGYNMPSKTLAYAYQGVNTSIHNTPVRNTMQDYADVRFIESKGAALVGVERALYSQTRQAKERFHWMFPADKDERVSSLLAWIQSVSYGLGSYGLHKFLQSRERGALLVNADFRPTKSPNEPAFDWLTFDQLQPTMDRILQESVVAYDPAMQVVVFVMLPSKTGNSVAIWRRKIAVPNNVRLAYQAQITQALAALRRDYPVFVEELPAKEPTSPSESKKKRKWWKFW